MESLKLKSDTSCSADPDAYDKIIQDVQRPSRYIGGEINSIIKKSENINLHLALVFPDLYEMGMSNLGLKILYHIINAHQDAYAERLFLPDTDFEEKLLQNHEPLRSLETRTPLNQFDIVGITLQYELSYTNVLKILKLGEIPLHRSKRDESFPLIIGGGPCTYNPEPVADFFDFFVIGEGEEVINEIIECYNELKRQGISRKKSLERFAEIKGIYVPSLFSISYGSDNRISTVIPLKKGYEKIEKRIIKDLDKAPYPASQVIPFAELIHDRISVEMDRGCTHGCRFCQAGIVYRPIRERSPAKIVELLGKSLEETGYEEISLGSLSAGDYSHIKPLLCHVMDIYEQSKTSVSFPSLRPNTINPGMLKEIGRVRKTGFTIAVEAASERLRRVINKKITDVDLFQAVHHIASAGWDSLKLYFMIGLPTETLDDIDELIELCQKILKKERRIKKINVSISSFIPKTHTPFQWEGQKKKNYIDEAMQRLKNKLTYRRISLKWNKTSMSYLEAVFSRGDRRLGKVIEKAMEAGCCFDGWSERFKPEIWDHVFKVCGIDPDWYAYRKMTTKEILPWDHIKTGVSKDYLYDEYKRSEEAQLTNDCRKNECTGCGLNPVDCQGRNEKSVVMPIPSGPDQVKSIPDVRLMHRLKYKKIKKAKYLSHLELLRVFSRALKRSKVPVLYSQGFHPHPKISFGLALPVGLESDCEYLDVQIGSYMSASELKQILNRNLPDGIKILEAFPLQSGYGSIAENTVGYRYLACLHVKDDDKVKQLLAESLAQEEVIIERVRKKGVKKVNIRPMIRHMEVVDEESDFLYIDFFVEKNNGILPQPLNILKGMLPGFQPSQTLTIIKKDIEWKKSRENTHVI